MKTKSIFFTDIHLKEFNVEQVRAALVDEGIPLCKKNEINKVFCLGDVFDSRISQKQIVLKTWGDILESYHNAGIEMICIRGNHDSSDYKSRDSFLEPYKYYPSFTLVDDIKVIIEKNIVYALIAFYDENIWLERFDELLEEIKKDKYKGMTKVCLTHMSLTGSRNNDGSLQSCKLSPSTFKCFDFTAIGHFHDFQKLSPSVVHIGALMQNNFAEDEKKGFWLFEGDDVKLVPTNQITFKKITVDLDAMTPDEIEEQITLFHASKRNDNDRIRIEVTGTQDKVSAFDKTKYSAMGIDVKPKIKEVEEVIDAEDKVNEIKVLTKTDIMDRFASFCKEKKYNADEASDILQKALGD